MITLITPTRNRKHCFKLLETYIARQTIQPTEWIVCNDGLEQYEYTMGQKVITRSPVSDPPGIHSICLNYLECIKHIKQKGIILCIEDDDWYRSDYIETMANLAIQNELFGLSFVRYFNCMTRQYKVFDNTAHSSLASTGFRKTLLPTFKRICEKGHPFIDMQLWEYPYKSLKRNEGECIQMKQTWLPGSTYQKGCHGIGSGHYPDGSWRSDNREETTLHDWLGEDADNYC